MNHVVKASPLRLNLLLPQPKYKEAQPDKGQFAYGQVIEEYAITYFTFYRKQEFEESELLMTGEGMKDSN